MTTPKAQGQARSRAEELEQDATAHPDEREEILLDAAGQWGIAGETERALRLYEDLATTAAEEHAQWAICGKIEVLEGLGRRAEADAEIERLRRSRPHPGPAGLVAEIIEERGDLEEALTWFNIACRDLLADDGEIEEIDEAALMSQLELQGRLRVREALGLPPDFLDERIGDLHGQLVDTDASAQPRAEQPAVAGSFFVRADVKRAFAEGLVQIDDPSTDDVDAYFLRTEQVWRAGADANGSAGFHVLPTTVDDLLAYAEELGLDPRDQRTRIGYLEDRAGEGAVTVSWPPNRNDPCWCASGRKYKKCCGSPSRR
ncbi:SEC-C metal-binding domain-containing protein [Actinomadura sp. 9N407]|uniref:SEC-C metal-binding domain-containing protein n=1 Tax=Actinomadura sp. 9N407 TaxID=3375154 RepID=UPI0037A50CD1